jgi:flavin-dependent dehydrogenase
MIPCGGVVSPVAAQRLLLVGDAAGLVSPVTAGGIHTALKHGLAAGHAIADYLNGKNEDPSGWLSGPIRDSKQSALFGSYSITFRATRSSIYC